MGYRNMEYIKCDARFRKEKKNKCTKLSKPYFCFHTTIQSNDYEFMEIQSNETDASTQTLII